MFRMRTWRLLIHLADCQSDDVINKVAIDVLWDFTSCMVLFVIFRKTNSGQYRECK